MSHFADPSLKSLAERTSFHGVSGFIISLIFIRFLGLTIFSVPSSVYFSYTVAVNMACLLACLKYPKSAVKFQMVDLQHYHFGVYGFWTT